MTSLCKLRYKFCNSNMGEAYITKNHCVFQVSAHVKTADRVHGYVDISANQLRLVSCRSHTHLLPSAGDTAY